MRGNMFGATSNCSTEINNLQFQSRSEIAFRVTQISRSKLNSPLQGIENDSPKWTARESIRGRRKSRSARRSQLGWELELWVSLGKQYWCCVLIRTFPMLTLVCHSMTMSEKIEQFFTNRPNSYVPGHTVGNLLGLDRDSHPDFLNHVHHWGLGIATTTVRAAMSYYGIIGPYSSFMFMALRLLTDEVLENSAGTSSPPWTWPINEQVLDLGHKAVFAFLSGYVCDRFVRGVTYFN